MTAGSKEAAPGDDVGLPPVGNALGPMPDKGQSDLPGTTGVRPREIVLGSGGPVGSDSMSSLPTSGQAAAPAAPPKKRGRPAGATQVSASTKKRIAAPPAAPPIHETSSVGLNMSARVCVKREGRESSLVFNSSATISSLDEFSVAVQKWHDEVMKAWGEELMKR